MLDYFTKTYRSMRRRWIYPLISLMVVLGLWLGSPIVAQAISWGDLILRGVQVIQLSNISNNREVALGQEINQQISRQVRINRDPQLNQYINQMGQQLAKNSSRTNIPYTFQVVDDNSINAFATMGGFVYINTGLMRLADNEAQLASVVGHEIGHIAARHAIQQMREMAIARGVATAAGLDRSTAVNIGVELALRRRNSRKDEFEADELGLQTLRQAGYAPSGAVGMMQKLLDQRGGRSVPTFLSTHPATEDRIERLKAAIGDDGANTGTGLDSAAYKAKISRLL